MAPKSQKEDQSNVQPGRYAVELKKLELAIEQEAAKAALSFTKALEAFAALPEIEKKVKETLNSRFASLSEEFSLNKVKFAQEILALEERKVQIEEEVKVAEVNKAEAIKELEKTQEIQFNDLKNKHKRELAEATYNFELEIREKGEAAAKKFLADRGLTSIGIVDLNDLKNYKKESEDDINKRIDEAVKAAEERKTAEFEHTNEVNELKRSNEIELLKQEVESGKALSGKLQGILNNAQKKDETLFEDIRKIVEAAARGVQNTIQQTSSSK